MDSIAYRWSNGMQERELVLVRIEGTASTPYSFGEPNAGISVSVPEFFMGATPITQAFWTHICGLQSPAAHVGPDFPVENVSWDRLTAPEGFLQRLNESSAADALRGQAGGSFEFRLPTEAEWEYAARGGPHWRDAYKYSGSNDIDAVAWYDRRHGDHTQPVARKAPNQLGLFDMSGNVWEWCQDSFTPDVTLVPRDGTPYEGPTEDRVLRGGCFHNWAAHCTVSKRYEIASSFHDGCIGLRVVLAGPRVRRPGA